MAKGRGKSTGIASWPKAERPRERLLDGERLSEAELLAITYGFGYALGMNFRNPQGRREMLWPQDLDEIALNGRTATGCRITGIERKKA